MEDRFELFQNLHKALLFSAERKVPVEATFKDENTQRVYVQGEKNPYTGIVEVKYENGKVKMLVNYKNGILDGKAIQYYENGNIMIEENYRLYVKKKLT